MVNNEPNPDQPSGDIPARWRSRSPSHLESDMVNVTIDSWPDELPGPA
jgi:hypothetical protein